MALNKAYEQYRQNSIFTSSPQELTSMLYNGLVRFIMRAKASLEQKDIPQTNEAIKRAQDIIIEFQNTLDKKYDVSKNLELVYDYMLRRLIEANISKDIEILDEVLGFAKELRNTWEEATKIAKQNK